jgi:tetratricopeptide (TPR) repeat protein
MKILEKIINYIIVALVFLLPLFFLPITSEFYLFNKNYLLIFTTCILLVLWGFKMVLNQTLNFKKSSFSTLVILFCLSFIVSTIFASPNKLSSLTGITGTIIALGFLYFIITNNLKNEFKGKIITSFLLSSSFLGLIAIYQFVGLGESLSNLAWLQDKLFTPAGGPLILISALLTGTSVAITVFLKKISSKNLISIVLSGGSSAICLLGLIFTAYQIFPGSNQSFVTLPYKEAWIIAIESLKRNPFFGTGPENFIYAFSSFRSVSFNNLAFWDIRFANSLIYPLSIVTTVGAIALGIYIALFSKIIKLVKTNFTKQEVNKTNLPIIVGLLALTITPLFLGSNILVISLWFLFLSFTATFTNERKTEEFKSKTFSWIVFAIFIALTIPVFFVFSKNYLADINFRKSLVALAENKGVDTFNYQTKAISLNPRNDDYRRTYSQTNFALANSLSLKENLSDQEKTQISQLIQQAIAESKVAANLNPQNPQNWENLGNIYRNLINVAEDADQWAVAVYKQAIITDPVNPRIRLDFGGLLFSLQDYESAIRQFQNAIELKPDYANAYYNLAATYKLQEKWPQAYSNLQVASSLIPTDSADYQKVQQELSEIAEKLPKEEQTVEQTEEASSLTPPEPLPSPAIEPIDLPEDAAPEIPEETFIEEEQE